MRRFLKYRKCKGAFRGGIEGDERPCRRGEGDKTAYVGQHPLHSPSRRVDVQEHSGGKERRLTQQRYRIAFYPQWVPFPKRGTPHFLFTATVHIRNHAYRLVVFFTKIKYLRTIWRDAQSRDVTRQKRAGKLAFRDRAFLLTDRTGEGLYALLVVI